MPILLICLNMCLFEGQLDFFKVNLNLILLENQLKFKGFFFLISLSITVIIEYANK